jgi:hypothetical protein
MKNTLPDMIVEIIDFFSDVFQRLPQDIEKGQQP